MADEPGRTGGLSRTRRTPRRMVSIRMVTGLASGVLALIFVMGSTASAVPQDPNSTPVPQDCDSDPTDFESVFLHPGAGRVLWDVTDEDEVTPGANYLIQAVELDVYVNGELVDRFGATYGNKTGRGDTFVCTFVETGTTPNGDSLVVYGTSWKVALP